MSLIALACVFSSCDKKSTETEANKKPSETVQTPEAPATLPTTNGNIGDMVSKMQGKWQSLDDAKNEIVVKDANFETFYDGKSVSVETIEFFENCPVECSASGTIDVKGMKCFMTKGQFDASCCSLLKLDEQNLEYAVIGSTGKALRFKRK